MVSWWTLSQIDDVPDQVSNFLTKSPHFLKQLLGIHLWIFLFNI